MPDFTFAPQEYITKVGQYLMTLPQHLEPYMTHDNLGLARALQERVFPFCSGVATVSATCEEPSDLEGTAELLHQQTPADFILSCIARATCQNYQEAILKIPVISTNSTKQLYTDIGYLGDILEDLGHPLTEGLQSIVYLLKLQPKDYWTSSNDHPQKLVSAISKMRSTYEPTNWQFPN